MLGMQVGAVGGAVIGTSRDGQEEVHVPLVACTPGSNRECIDWSMHTDCSVTSA